MIGYGGSIRHRKEVMTSAPRTRRRLALAAVATAALAVSASAAVAAPAPAAAVTTTVATAGPHYYVLIGGTCDGAARTYKDEWLRGGIPLRVTYPAGGTGLPNCNSPMDQSVQIGREAAKRLIRNHWDPSATYTIVGYSQGAIVANLVLEDLADGRLPLDRSRFRAKLYADPMAPVGPPGRGLGAVIPKGWGAPSPFGGYVSPGAGRTNFGGIPFIRYCIRTDGVCHFDTFEAAGGYFAQHQCYWERPIMANTIADGVFTNRSQELPKQDCRPPWPI